MRLHRHPQRLFSALIALFLAVWLASAPRAGAMDLDDVSDETVGVEPEPAPAAPPAARGSAPGLGEATRTAVSEIRAAARRDASDWAVRMTQLQEDLVLGAKEAWRSFRRDPIDAADEWLASIGLPSSQTLALPAALLFVLLVVAWFIVRSSGDLVVSISYPAELRGTFSVRLSRRKKDGHKGARTSSPIAAERAKRRASSSSRTERHLVSHDANFQGTRIGHWYVIVDGFVQPQDDETVLAAHFDVQEVRVRRGHTARLDFDFHPKHSPVDVKVMWDKRPVTEAMVAWRGQPHSMRFARGGPVRLGAIQGDQVLVVGSGDRVAEMPLTVSNYQPISLEVDLADREKLLFTGCPPAVEPYLHGDISAAARALEREGQDEVAHLLLARLHEERSMNEAAARHFAQAGRLVEAAEIHKGLAQFEKAAVLLETAGEYVRAAECYRSAGDPMKAGEAFEKARDFERAGDCFREAGDTDRWIDALEKGGDPMKAARQAMAHGDSGRAIRSLQTVGPAEEEYVAAANLLLDAYQSEGHLDLAAEKMDELIQTKGVDAVPLDTCDRLASGLEEVGEWESALQVLEVIRSRDATWSNLATRIEGLRKRRQRENEQNASSGSNSDASTPGFRYEILEEVGRGGMGIVFKARDLRLGRLVALKRLPDNLRNHPKAVELFLREARAAAALNHPNIVTVHDAGQEGESYFIAMELMEGLPLLDILRRKGRFGARDVARLGLQVCAGLEYAHAQRVVHRDIKTGNLFFTKGKTVKIMDFGLAKMVEEVRKASTIIGGTPYYMAPEQSQGASVDHRADLYSLGVTFFEMLTGKVPFTEGDVAFHHRHTPAPDPRDRTAGIPDSLAELVLEMMAKDPAARPETAARVAARLQAVANTLTSLD